KTVVDTTPPVVSCSVAAPLLRPPDHSLVNVGLTATASDVCSGSRPVTVSVFGNEDDQTATGDTSTFSPDTANIASGTLRVRAERAASGGGRIYLLVPKASDPSANTSFACCSVVVPRDMSAASIQSINSQAASAVAFCASHNGTAPAGYFVV